MDNFTYFHTFRLYSNYCNVLQMTGLDITKDKIIEIACMVTNGNLETVAEVNYYIKFYCKIIGRTHD